MTSPTSNDITVRILLHDELSAPARRAAESLDELTRAARRARRELHVLQSQVRSLGMTIARGTVLNNAYTASLTRMTAALRLNSLAHHNNANAANHSATAHNNHANATNNSSRRTQRFGRVLKSLNGILRIVTMSVGLLTVAMIALSAVGPLLSGVQGLGAVISVLGSLAAFAAYLPTALFSLISVMLTLKVALGGIGEGIAAAASGDWAKLDEAMKKASPSARIFLGTIAEFGPQFKQLKMIVQESLFKNLIGLVKPLLKTVLPQLTAGMSLVANSAGKFAATLVKFFTSTSGKQFLGAMFVGGADLLDGLSSGLAPLLDGLAVLMDHMAPKWKEFTVFVGDLMRQFGQWLEAISSDGRLDRWLEMAQSTAMGLWEAFKAVWGILQSIFTAMGDGVAILGAVSLFLGSINEYLKSTEGKQALLDFFNSLNQVFVALQPIMKIVLEALVNTIAPSLVGIIQGLAPGFIVFLQALSTGLAALIPYWPMLAKGIGDILAALAPLLPPLGMLIGLLGGMLGKALTVLATILAPFIEAAMIPLVKWFELAATLFEQEGPMLEYILVALSDAFSTLAPFMTTVAELLAQQGEEYIPMVMKVLNQLLPVILELVAAYGNYLQGALEALAPMLPELIDAFFQIVFAMLQLYPAMIPIIEAFTQLLNEVIVPHLPEIMLLVQLFIDILVIILKLTAAAIVMGAQVAGVLAKMVAFSLEVSGKLFDALIGPWGKAFKWIKENFIDPILRAISGILEKMSLLPGSDIVSGSGRSLGGGGATAGLGARWMGGPVEGGKSYMTGELGPEIFVDTKGNTKMLGEFGPSVEHFTNPGYVVPNHKLDAFESIRNSMAKHQASLNDRTQATVASGKNGQPAVEVKGGDTYQIDVNFHGEVKREVDIERTIRRTIKKLDQEKKERR